MKDFINFWNQTGYKNGSLVKEFQKYPNAFDTRVCVTAQRKKC